MDTLVAATDGSYLADPDRPTGAWAYSIAGRPPVVGAVHGHDVTATRMELQAVAELLAATDPDVPLHVLVDYRPLCRLLSRIDDYAAGGWRRTDGTTLANIDLLDRLQQLTAGRDVTVQWVRGHGRCRANQTVDRAARSCARAARRCRLRRTAA